MRGQRSHAINPLLWCSAAASDSIALGVEIQQAREEHENEANFTQVEVVFWLGNSP